MPTKDFTYTSPSRRDRPTRGITLVRALVCALIVVLTLASCDRTKSTGSGVSTGSAAQPAPQGPYVALGDSYTAGPDIPEQVGDPSGCERSSENYPSLVAQGLKLTPSEVRDVSCSGATIADLSKAQVTSDGTNPAQLSALSASTGIVTLGFGGNDVDFTSVMTRCVELDMLPVLIDRNGTADLAPCLDYYSWHGVNQIEQKIQAASGQLSVALKQIETRAPHARIFVVGYPALVPDGGSTCANTLGITEGDVKFIYQEEQSLNSMLRQRATSAGATYVDTYTPSIGHDACSDESVRWIEPLVPASPAAALHPNARGEQGMAAAVLSDAG